MIKAKEHQRIYPTTGIREDKRERGPGFAMLVEPT